LLISVGGGERAVLSGICHIYICPDASVSAG
jgi:hypothetical protein